MHDLVRNADDLRELPLIAQPVTARRIPRGGPPLRILASTILAIGVALASAPARAQTYDPSYPGLYEGVHRVTRRRRRMERLHFYFAASVRCHSVRSCGNLHAKSILRTGQHEASPPRQSPSAPGILSTIARNARGLFLGRAPAPKTASTIGQQRLRDRGGATACRLPNSRHGTLCRSREEPLLVFMSRATSLRVLALSHR
jgi:hypothetical protein